MTISSSKDKNNNINQEKDDKIANLTIHSIFVKDISYESPSVPQVFSIAWEPGIKFDIQVMRRVIDQVANLYEVVLHANVSSKLNTINPKDPKSQGQEVLAFLIDIKLAGMFTVTGLPEAHLDRVLSTTAPTIIFPYIAENISSLVTRGGFPQFILPPIDFFALYQQRSDSQNLA